MKVDGTRALDAFRRYPGRPQPARDATSGSRSRRWCSTRRTTCRPRTWPAAWRARGVAVGLATVYRTLDLLVTSGLVAQRDFGEGFKRYEPMPPGQAHEHCICSACGRVMEFSNDRLERMIALLAEEVEFRPHHHRLEVFGLCRDCQQSNPLARTR